VTTARRSYAWDRANLNAQPDCISWTVHIQYKSHSSTMHSSIDKISYSYSKKLPASGGLSSTDPWPGALLPRWGHSPQTPNTFSQCWLFPPDLGCLDKTLVERITVVKFGVNDRGSNGTCSWGIEIRPDTAKLTNVIVAAFGERCNLVREEGKVFVKDKAKISSRVGGVKWIKSSVFWRVGLF